MPHVKYFTRDITKAYFQSKTALELEVHITAPHEMNQTTRTILNVIKHIYGIPEGRLHCYWTYLDHNIERLGMNRTTIDPCILFKCDNNGLNGMVILPVEDSFDLEVEAFRKDEEEAASVFRGNPWPFLQSETTTFNGTRLSQQKDGSIKIEQSDKIFNLKPATTQN